MLSQALWWTAMVVLGGYVLLFVLARRPVSLRLVRVGWALIVLVILRLVLALLSVPLQASWEWVVMATLTLVGLGLVLARRVWLVRATVEELRQQIETACRGLFLGFQNQPGRVQLTARGEPALRLRRLTGRTLVLVLCRPPASGKVALLCDWLAKQYPGPVPRVRIILLGGAI